MASEPSKYLNRELCWLEFNQRVLDEAHDKRVPLLERLRFLAITASNLDEFFMVRVGGLQLLAEHSPRKRDPSGMTPKAQLRAIRHRTTQMVADQYHCLLEQLDPALAAEGIRRLQPAELNDRQRRHISQVFEQEIFPVLTPMAVSGREDFPLLANQTLNVCVRLSGQAPLCPSGNQRPGTKPADGGGRFAVIPLSRTAHRFLTLPSDGGYAYVLVEDVLQHFAQRFFPNEHVMECAAFRITRNADISVREDQAPDLLTGMEEVLDWRKQSPCVRLELAASASESLRRFLQQALQVDQEKVFALRGPLDLAAFMHLADIPGFESLRYDPWPPQPSPAVDPRSSMFDVLSRRDVLLYHPYESFDPVLRLIEEAADDPDVLAIKQTLYRTSRNSPIIAALIRAAEAGKYVTAVVELKARFDEERNIEWAKTLEQAGAQVIYGVKGLKTHAKVCIIVRREPQGVRRYVHFGTGNYNESTARLYSDVSYLTSNDELGDDAIHFFNAVTGFSQPQQFCKIEAAPLGLREKLLEMIQIETRFKEQGRRAGIVAKMNSLVDPDIIDALYNASQAGVPIKLNVRGICCLRPGVKGLSENITVISIVDRYLEHARIFSFHHGGDRRVFISSADWMPRNLDRRVELLVPVEDHHCRQRLLNILDHCFLDTVKAAKLTANGSYQRIRPRGRRRLYRCQQALYEQACEAVRQLEQSKRTVLEPHQAPDRRS